jgi:hypothetical protein
MMEELLLACVWPFFGSLAGGCGLVLEPDLGGAAVNPSSRRVEELHRWTPRLPQLCNKMPLPAGDPEAREQA